MKSTSFSLHPFSLDDLLTMPSPWMGEGQDEGAGWRLIKTPSPSYSSPTGFAGGEEGRKISYSSPSGEESGRM